MLKEAEKDFFFSVNISIRYMFIHSYLDVYIKLITYKKGILYLD